MRVCWGEWFKLPVIKGKLQNWNKKEEKFLKKKKKKFLTDSKVFCNVADTYLNSDSEIGYSFETWNKVKEVK